MHQERVSGGEEAEAQARVPGKFLAQQGPHERETHLLPIVPQLDLKAATVPRLAWAACLANPAPHTRVEAFRGLVCLFYRRVRSPLIPDGGLVERGQKTIRPTKALNPRWCLHYPSCVCPCVSGQRALSRVANSRRRTGQASASGATVCLRTDGSPRRFASKQGGHTASSSSSCRRTRSPQMAHRPCPAGGDRRRLGTRTLPWQCWHTCQRAGVTRMAPPQRGQMNACSATRHLLKQ